MKSYCEVIVKVEPRPLRIRGRCQTIVETGPNKGNFCKIKGPYTVRGNMCLCTKHLNQWIDVESDNEEAENEDEAEDDDDDLDGFIAPEDDEEDGRVNKAKPSNDDDLDGFIASEDELEDDDDDDDERRVTQKKKKVTQKRFIQDDDDDTDVDLTTETPAAVDKGESDDESDYEELPAKKRPRSADCFVYNNPAPAPRIRRFREHQFGEAIFLVEINPEQGKLPEVMINDLIVGHFVDGKIVCA